MTTLFAALQEYGLMTVLAGVVVYILLRGEFVFRYPRQGEPKE